MNTRELIATYLTFGVAAAKELTTLEPGQPRWDDVSNGVITAVTIAALAAEVRALDPERADELAGLIEAVLADEDTAATLLEQWGHTINRGEDFRLTEVPEVDEGPVITPEGAEHLDRQARAALNGLAQFDRAHADRVWANYQNPDHPTSASDVIREASAALQQHQSRAAQSSPTYQQHQEPRRGSTP
jgi:hypothetical protein